MKPSLAVMNVGEARNILQHPVFGDPDCIEAHKILELFQTLQEFKDEKVRCDECEGYGSCSHCDLNCDGCGGSGRVSIGKKLTEFTTLERLRAFKEKIDAKRMPECAL